MNTTFYRQKAWIDIKSLRINRGWSQLETAQRLGIARSYLSALENNKCGFSMQVVNSVIRVFGVRYEDFYA